MVYFIKMDNDNSDEERSSQGPEDKWTMPADDDDTMETDTKDTADTKNDATMPILLPIPATDVFSPEEQDEIMAKILEAIDRQD